MGEHLGNKAGRTNVEHAVLERSGTMLALTISALFTVVALASALALADCWVRGRYVFEGLRQERALLDAGFVPVAQPVEQRIRKTVRFEALSTPARLPAQRHGAPRARPLPVSVPLPAIDAA